MNLFSGYPLLYTDTHPTNMLVYADYDRIMSVTPISHPRNGYYEKYGLLTSVRICGTITKEDEGRDAHYYGETENRILDCQAGVRTARNAVHHRAGLDQGWYVSSLPAWRALEGQEDRNGGVGTTTEEHSTQAVTQHTNNGESQSSTFLLSADNWPKRPPGTVASSVTGLYVDFT